MQIAQFFDSGMRVPPQIDHLLRKIEEHPSSRGQRAVFCYEFEVLNDIEVPVGGIVIQSDTGVVVHGKSTLEYGSVVPRRVARGSLVRFRQEVALEIVLDLLRTGPSARNASTSPRDFW